MSLAFGRRFAFGVNFGRNSRFFGIRCIFSSVSLASFFPFSAAFQELTSAALRHRHFHPRRCSPRSQVVLLSPSVQRQDLVHLKFITPSYAVIFLVYIVKNVILFYVDFALFAAISSAQESRLLVPFPNKIGSLFKEFSSCIRDPRAKNTASFR